MQIRQCEMCDYCNVKVHTDKTLDVSCYKDEDHFCDKFDNKIKCESFKPVALYDFYPLIFTKICLKGR